MNEIKDKTPKEYMCIIGNCPAIYENKEKDSYLIVGKKVPNSDEIYAELKDRVGEFLVVEIPKGLLKKLMEEEKIKKRR